jgi:hypothetical protein
LIDPTRNLRAESFLDTVSLEFYVVGQEVEFGEIVEQRLKISFSAVYSKVALRGTTQ